MSCLVLRRMKHPADSRYVVSALIVWHWAAARMQNCYMPIIRENSDAGMTVYDPLS